jgi:hypothetical protein
LNFTGLYGVTFKKMVLFIEVSVRTLNPREQDVEEIEQNRMLRKYLDPTERERKGRTKKLTNEELCHC